MLNLKVKHLPLGKITKASDAFNLLDTKLTVKEELDYSAHATKMNLLKLCLHANSPNPSCTWLASVTTLLGDF